MNEKSNNFYCFGCGERGDLIDFYIKFFKLTFQQAVKEICIKYNIEHNKAPKNYMSRAQKEDILEDKLILNMEDQYIKEGIKFTDSDKKRIALAKKRLLKIK